MPFFSTSPAGARSTLVRDRLGRLLYSHANDDNDTAAEEEDGGEGELPAD